MAARSEDEDEFTEKIRQLEKEKKRLERLNSERKYKELCKSVTALRESSSSLYSTEPAQYESSAGSSSSPGRDRSRASARFDDMSSDSGISGILNEQRNLLKSLQRRSGESSRDVLGGRGQQRESGSDSEEDCAKDTRNLDKVMSKEHKQKLQQNRDTLVENLIPEDIFNDLIANKVLTTPEVGRIKEKNTRESINEELLDNLIRKSDRAFYKFVKSLRKTLQDHLADLIDDMIRDDRTRDDRNRSKRKRKTGELNISLDCEDISPVGRKKRVCTCAEVEEQILVMAKTAYQAIRRRDGTPASFEQFKKELRQTNEVIKESMEIMHTLKILCKHGELDISYGSVRFTLNCSSMRCVQNVWEMYQSGKLLALFQEKFVSRQLLKMCGARTIKLGVRIAEHEYWKCIKELEKSRVSIGPYSMKKKIKASHNHNLRSRKASMNSKSENIQDNLSTISISSSKGGSETSRQRRAFQEIHNTSANAEIKISSPFQGAKQPRTDVLKQKEVNKIPVQVKSSKTSKKLIR